MDACDDVMRRIGKPEKLITHTSYNAVVEGAKARFFTPRIVAYLSVFVLDVLSIHLSAGDPTGSKIR